MRTSNWMRSKDGAKNRNRPKPVSPLAKSPTTQYGKTDRPPHEVIALLEKMAPGRHPAAAAAA